MISLEKWMILAPLQKLPKNVGDLGKLIATKGFKKLPKVQKIAQSGHTGTVTSCRDYWEWLMASFNFILSGSIKEIPMRYDYNIILQFNVF